MLSLHAFFHLSSPFGNEISWFSSKERKGGNTHEKKSVNPGDSRGSGGPAGGLRGPCDRPHNTPPEETHTAAPEQTATLTCRIVDGAEEGILLLADLENASGIYRMGVGDGVSVTVDGAEASAADLTDGMEVTVIYDGMVQESYPMGFYEVYALEAVTPPGGSYTDLCGFYLQVLDDLWQADDGLNGDTVGIDLSQAPGGLTEAEQAAAMCKGVTVTCTSVTKEQKKEQPPKLYDLTTLQREANRLFGYTAKQTLDYAQSLYEKKLLTYPRTDSRYLTSDMAETASCVIHLAAKLPPFDGCSNFFPLVETMISDKDVSDHHAIIPTMEIEKADLKLLPVGERNLLLLVCCKLLCASAELYVYEAVTATFDCGGYSFTAKGKRILSEGWREIDRIFRAFLKEKPADGDGGTLPDFTEGQIFDSAEIAVTEHFTQPPKTYTEDTLLSAMENAGKDDIPDEAERKGLGTPATRAAIIEKLVAAGFVERKGKSLIPTKAGINLVTVLPEPLTSPMLTAEWEQKLTEIAKGGADPDTFMGGIRTMVREIVSTYSCISEDGKKLFAPEKEVIGTCPRCGQPVYEGKKNFACSDRSCGFVLWKNDRFWTSRKKELTKKMAADLLKKGRTNVKGMWSEKKQTTYDAAVILNDTGGKYINFKLEFPKRKVGADGRK